MDQIIKLTTQMATTAITQIIVDKIIANAKNLNENSEFDFDTFFTVESINQVITMEKMKITEARKILNINKKKTAKDPNKPKKFNGYLMFCKEERVKLKKDDEFKDSGFSDIAKELGSRWRSLSEDDKNMWKKKAIMTNLSIEDSDSDTNKKKINKKPNKKINKKKKSKKKTKKKTKMINKSSDESYSSSEESSDDFSDDISISDSDEE